MQRALQQVSAAIPADWRRGTVKRADLARFLFAPDDVVIDVGQDGLVANTAKYLDGQPVIGLNPEPAINPGVLVGTGTGSTGWCRSAWQERDSMLDLPEPTHPRLSWFVREAWPSPATGTELTEGILDAGESLELTCETDGLVVFGDGIGADCLTLAWGQKGSLHAASQHLHLVR